MLEHLITPLAETDDRAAIRDAVTAICDRFDDAYWSAKDREAAFEPGSDHEPWRDAGAENVDQEVGLLFLAPNPRRIGPGALACTPIYQPL